MAESDQKAAPYIVGLAVAAVGWLLSTATNDLQEAKVAAFQVRQDGRVVSSTIENLSKRSALAQLHFELICPDPRGCFVNNPAWGSSESKFVAEPPTGIANSVFNSTDARSIDFSITLPPGSKISLLTYLAASSRQMPSLSIQPDTPDSQSTYVMPAGWLSFSIAHYYDILAAAFCIGVGVIVIWSLLAGLATLTKTRKRAIMAPGIVDAP